MPRFKFCGGMCGTYLFVMTNLSGIQNKTFKSWFFAGVPGVGVFFANVNVLILASIFSVRTCRVRKSELREKKTLKSFFDEKNS